MADYPCQYCDHRAETFKQNRVHMETCPGLKQRLDNLGSDLAVEVQMGRMKLADAEAEQATRPKLVL
ncbi:hypothetical protein vBCbaSRXM_80 [Citromicrobium phage vB_CbaS-RXM]|nr:hypothetical protein vBCbaSRXM_80 [Citromicrobium phage vB_CbaS-RXM]